jgi:hypothetical protein
MIRNLLIATAVTGVSSGICFGAAAQTCAERCDAAYKGCAALEAAGCEIGGQLAGEAAEQLGGEIPIPGMGALFGSLARDTTAQKCVELLGPCQQIRTTCLAGCPPVEGQAVATAMPQAIRYSTLRVFADRPRTIVYINEQRMGATPEDALEPFVSPELPVGRYWVRLTSPDGEWEWRGEKTVEEGNLNAVEGTLANRRVALHERARALDAAGETVRAAAAYRELLVAFQSDAEIKQEAEARLAALFPAFQVADEEMFRRIGAEAEPQKRAVLCRVYLDEFAGGAFRPQVQTALTEIEKALPRPRRPGEPAPPPPADERARIEAVVGEDLGQYHAAWQRARAEQSAWAAGYPKFSDFMDYYYESQRKAAIALMVVFDVIGVAGLVVGPVLIEKSKKNGDEDYLIAGAIVTGESGAIVIVASILGPVKSFQAKKKREKLAGMRATALQSPRLQFAGFSPLVDKERSPSGLALSWEY